MIYLTLFLTFFKIGLFSFGGGYAMLPLISREVVTRHGWLTMGQFTDIIAISQVTPGPIAINTATYIGYTITNSVFGSFLATFGVTLPSITVMVLLLKLVEKYRHLDFIEYAFKGLKIIIIGLIFGAALLLMNKENLIDYKSYIIMILALIANFKYKVSAIPLILTAAVIGLICY